MATFGVSLSSDSAGPVVAGTKVSGFVWADVKKELSGRSLDAFMYGEERCKVRYTTGSGDNRRTRYANASRPLLQVQIPVNQQEILVNGKVPPGRYELPFEIELPESLPSTMHTTGDGGSCSVRYYIKVQLKGSGWISDYKASRDVIVTSKPLPKDPVPCITEPVTESVNFCCCFNRGTISFGANVDDTVLERGESVRVAMSCINDTSSDIKQVKAMLTETITWNARGRRNKRQSSLGMADFGRIQGMDKKTKSQLNLRDGGGYEQQNYDLIFRDIKSGSHVGVLRNPESANDTFYGSLITIQHYITIEVKTGGCVDNPKIVIPIQSGTPSRFAAHSPPAPGSVPEPEQEIVLPPDNFSDGATVVSPVFVPGTAASVGGVMVDSEDGEPEFSFSLPSSPNKPSLPNLMKELDESVRDLDIIEDKLNDPEWKAILVNLKPAEFADIVGKVDLDFDQPKVAQLVAPVILDGHFTCKYLLAVLKTTSNWNRINMVEKLLPYCVDLASQQEAVKAELSDWEKTVTEQAFKESLNAHS